MNSEGKDINLDQKDYDIRIEKGGQIYDPESKTYSLIDTVHFGSGFRKVLKSGRNNFVCKVWLTENDVEKDRLLVPFILNKT